MAADRWHLISRIYHEAMAREPAARDAFLREASAGDEHVEREVRSLLAQASGDSFLEDLLPGQSTVASNGGLTLTGTLGRFELRGLLGAGGMGEVYRAHDATLGRDVAVKILPRAFTTDPDRLARFEREARVLAALNHPHIAAIYGVEQIPREAGAEGTAARALVLELVDGETLAERLGRGAMSVSDALESARQIAAALEAAHDKGIVHRDLKPANVKVRPDGTLKVLDFGLAKAEGLTSRAPGSDAPAGETSAGVILGTPAYMSPEQARGQTVDKRTDVWAFGCLLYQMLAGHAPFGGETPSDILAAVLEREPDWGGLPGTTPPSVRRLLRRCLEKNPKRRLRDMGDARLELDEGQPGASMTPGRAARGAWMLVAGAVLAASALGYAMWTLWPRSGPPPQPVQFTLVGTAGQVIEGVPMPSPDGRHLLYAARARSGESALWVRPLGSSVALRLNGTDDAQRPFWSPTSEWVGFSANGVLKRTRLSGGPVQRITDLDPTMLGATWNSDNLIVFTPSNKKPLYRVPAAGGRQEPLTTLNSERRENSHRWPHFLPDGRHFLFTARSDLPEHTGIYAASIDDPGNPKWLLAAQSSAIYVSSGFLLFVRDNTLLAQPFDAAALQLSGEPVAVAGDVVGEREAAYGAFAASADAGVLAYNVIAPSRLVWFDRNGAEAGSIGARGDFGQIRLSPEGVQAAVVLPDPQNGNRDVWVIALASGAFTRITSHPAADWFPVWSADGTEVIFASDREATPTFYRAAAKGGGNEQLVFRASSRDAIYPTDWSSDRRALLIHSYPRGDISLLPLSAAAAPTRVVASPFTDWTGSLSPDGRWIAYVSDESGAHDVYVRSIGGSARHRISVGGGLQPRWRRDSRELFFLGAGDKLFSVAIGAPPSFTPDPPKALFAGCPSARPTSAFMYRYDVTADGKRSLWICGGDGVTATIAVHGLPAAPGAGR
jgi:Tol biopolymer transport system component